MDFLAYVVIAGLACSYLVRVFLLEQKISYEGPFVLQSTFVLFEDTKHIQRFAFFDLIRFICGAYKRVPEITAQRVYTLRNFWIAEIWTCPLCLSFWVAFPINFILSITHQTSFLLSIETHFAIACISYFIFDRTQE